MSKILLEFILTCLEIFCLTILFNLDKFYITIFYYFFFFFQVVRIDGKEYAVLENAVKYAVDSNELLTPKENPTIFAKLLGKIMKYYRM